MYCTKAQMIKWFSEQELIQRTDRQPFAGSINDEVLNEAIASASVVINGYLRSVYTLPLATEVIDASPLPMKCGDIARYNLYPNLSEDENNPVRLRYKDAIAWLKDVAAKKVSLGAEDDTVTETGGMAVVTGSSRIDWCGY